MSINFPSRWREQRRIGPLGLALSPDDRRLFVAGLHSLALFQRDPLTGALEFLQADFEGEGGVTGISYPTRPAVSHDGGDVFVPGFWSMPPLRRHLRTRRS